ncbi:MAG: penicillin-binding protein 2 [Chloroflexi bacterium]|nr:penicillin-binding protein 2 [Chloroflexota bacterium]
MILGRTDSRGRLLFLLLAFLLASSALVARLSWWQIARRDDLAASAHRQIYLRTVVPAKRGSIFDRSGTVVLAASVTRDRLTANPRVLSSAQREALISLLTTKLGLVDAGVADLRSRLAVDRTYAIIARDLVPETTQAIIATAADAGIPGLGVESAQVRQYPQSGGGPQTSLAAQLLGFVNRDGQGQYGVEQYYQDQLAGTPTIMESDRDANGQPVVETQHTVAAGSPGTDLSLTIDAGLQLAVEQEVMAAWVADRAKSVSAVVMDPYTGAILAEATYPSYDANDYAAVATSDANRFIDPIVSSVYEPGSVFKMPTVIAGLETGTATLDKEYDDSGLLRLDNGRTKITDADRKPMGILKLADAIAFSRNVVAARVALGLAPTLQAAAKVLHEVWTRLGFGAPTGVDLAGETGGLVHDPTKSAWGEIDLANGSFGQGVAVTPIQLADAYAAMVNGGTLVRPHVVGAIDGVPVTVKDRGRVLDASLSPKLIDLMNHVVTTVPFYRDRTLIPGYYVGGKTGTAQIWDSTVRDWKPDVFNFSFVGYVGRKAGRPDVLVAVKINEGVPTVRRVGQLAMPVMSFELFRRIATDTMAVPGLLPDLPPDPVASERPGH